MTKTNYQRLIEDRLGMPLEQKILQCVQSGMSDSEIAEALSVPHATAKSWRQKYIVTEARLREPASAGR